MHKISKRLITTLSVVFMVILSSANVEAEEIKVNRLAGKDRIETSIEISRYAKAETKTAIIASTSGSVDALASTLLTSQTDGVQLLTGPKNLDKRVKLQLEQLKVENIYLVGGESVLSKSIEDELAKQYKVKRLSGNGRVETSLKVIEELSQISDSYFIVNGYDGLADALSIGPVAGKNNSPILLTKKNSIPKETITQIRKHTPSKITIIGGESVVGKAVENELKAYANVSRISGRDRSSTSIEIAKEYYESPKGVILANGHTFADALSGGYYAAEENEPLVLVSNNSNNRTARDYVKENKTNLTVLGGNEAVSKNVKRNFIASATNTEDRINTKDELVEEILRAIRNRESVIDIDYYGEGFTTTKSVSDIIIPLHRTGEYKIANIKRWTTSNGNRDGFRKIIIRPEYRTTDKEEAFVDSEVRRISKNIINSKMTDFVKVREIHDYLVNNIEYTGNTIGHSGSSHTLFKEGKGVCNAYALAMSKLLDYNNIENYYIVGDGKARNGDSWGLHAWNKVKVNNRWYNIDATWNFPKAEYGLHNAYYNFLVSDKRFYKNHRPHYLELLPKSTDSQYDGMYDGNFSRK